MFLSERDGKVQGIRSLISYEGATIKELQDDFHGAVDDYLAPCEAEGDVPEIPSGKNRAVWLTP